MQPALTKEEWERGIPGVCGFDDGSVFIDWRHSGNVERPEAVIAALNAALPDDDPRKITQEMVDALDESIAWGAECDDACSDTGSWRTTEMEARYQSWRKIRDALASYLPPKLTP